MEIKKITTVMLTSLLGALLGNVLYYTVRSYHQLAQVQAGTLPDTETIAPRHLAESGLGATLLAAQVGPRPGATGFLLGLFLALVGQLVGERV